MEYKRMKVIHKLDKNPLKFRASILGVLIGDCLGSPYENERMLTSGEKIVLQNDFDKLEGIPFAAPVKQYTDDSAMTMSVCQSLIEHKDLNLLDMAQKFVKSFYKEPHRGYGPGVVTVFKKLRGSKFADLMKPATEQFDGSGSMGNGGAMRVAPMALFYQNDDRLIDMVRQATQLTHTHNEGVNGAILQALAIHQCLNSRLSYFDVGEYMDVLIKKMEEIEKNDEEYLDLEDEEVRPYRYKLMWIKRKLEYFSPQLDIKDEDVVSKLGHHVTAVDSVPLAIYCFLRAYYPIPIPGIKTENPFRRAIQYAITLGGDTDTIASMTGAIAGALYGFEMVNESLLKHCEASREFWDIADKLYEVATSKKN